MFDARLRPLIDPPLNAVGRWLAARGIGANAVTLAGLVPALGAGLAIVEGQHLLALALIVLNRLLDGLDGAVARASELTDLGRLSRYPRRFRVLHTQCRWPSVWRARPTRQPHWCWSPPSP
jgi:hypothetical protein